MNTETLLQLFGSLPPNVAIFLIAMLPVAELRGAIPVALTVYQLPVWLAYSLALIGNIIPGAVLLWLLGPTAGYLSENSQLAKRFFDWLFTRTRHKFAGKYERWGALALVLFVAVPLPVTGVWTGAVAAFLFGIPKRRALALLSLGAAIAGGIVTMATIGIISIF